jgi:hypothetical protein
MNHFPIELVPRLRLGTRKQEWNELKMTSSIDRGVGAFCPDCGANVRTEVSHCWLCFRPLPPTGGGPLPPPPGTLLPSTDADETDSIRRVPPKAATWQFSLQTILLIMTLLAVCLGAYHNWPGLGTVLTAIATPALIGIIAMGAERRRRGLPMSAAEKIGGFLAMFGVLLLTAVAAIAALLVACGVLAFGMEGTRGSQWIVGLVIVAAMITVAFAASAIGMLSRVIRMLRS